jgi:Subtilase family
MGKRPARVLAAAVAALFAAALAIPVSANTTLVDRPGSLGKLSADQITRLAAQANQRSIILLKNQHRELPPRPGNISRRAQAVRSDQESVRDELAVLHARNVKGFQTVNAVAATISKDEATRLASNPAVRAVVPDLRRTTPAAAGGSIATAAAAAAAAVQPAAATPGQPICPSDPSVPLLEPEALQVMNVENQPGDGRPAAHDLADGSGIKVGIIADGLDPNNPDLIRNGQSIVYDYRDFSGYGTGAPTDGREAFLDAGAVAAQGNQVYDLAQFVNPAHPLAPGCDIRIKGVAPGASLAVLNVAGSAAGFFNSQIIQAIDWAVTQDRVDVLNESIGGNPYPDQSNDPVAIADNNAVAAGITVVTSSGDAGPTNTISSPASDPGVIAVGGTTTYRVYRQATRYGVQLVPGGWENNNISALSSAGTTQSGPRTIDVVAPGDRGWALCSADLQRFFGCADVDNNNVGQPLWAAGGTSLSAPLTAGTAALVMQAYAKTHNGARPSPDLVKRIIVSTAQDLGAPAEHQGAGLVNALKAVQLAASVQDASGSPGPQGQSLLVSKPSLVTTVQAGTSPSFNVDVTNTGSVPTQLSPSLASLDPQPVSTDTGRVNLSGSSPNFVDSRGRPSLYQLHSFDVPSGVDYLNGDIIWNAQAQSPAGQPGSVVYETVWDPAGNVAAHSVLSDSSGHGHVEVGKPAAGSWTAAIWTLKNAGPSNLGQYTGDVGFSYSTQRLQNSAGVTPAALSLAPGQTGSLTVTVPASPQAGDRAASLRLASGAPDDGAIPVVVRSLVSLGAAGGSFQGILSGGAALGQQFTYQFDMPDGKPTLNLSLSLPDQHYPVFGYLVDPSGQPLDVQNTAVGRNAKGTTIYGNAMQFFRRTPAPGRWTLVVRLDQRADALDGQNFTEPVSGNIDFNPVPVSVAGLPNSPFAILPQGQAATASVRLTNTGNSSKSFFVDPRLSQPTFQQLLGYQATGVPLPLSLGVQPYFYVPPQTDLLFVGAQGTVPIVMDVKTASGGSDVLASTLPDNQATAVLSASELAPSGWFALPEAQGPFGVSGVGGATVDLGAVAETNAFDSAVTSSTGDAWLQMAVDNSSPYSPLTLAPGQSGTINLTITPNAAIGSVVQGFIGVDTMNGSTMSGDEITLLPYTYTVG